MTNVAYTIHVEPDTEEGGYVVTVPALPGCITEADTYEQAIEMAKDAVSCYLQGLAKQGQPFPNESQPHQPKDLIIDVGVPASA